MPGQGALIAACLLASTLWSADDGGFRPRLLEPVPLPASVRPGSSFPLVLRFINDGSAAAVADHRVFVHLERERDCRTIAENADHEPTLPTTLWRPGQEVVDGPLVVGVRAEAAPGTYQVHVGVYGERRYSDAYAGQIRIAADAPLLPAAAELAEEEVARRRAAWQARARDLEVVEGAELRLGVERATGAFAITDKATGVVWESDPYQGWLGEAWLRDAGALKRLPLTAPVIARQGQALHLTFRQADGRPALAVELRVEADGRSLSFTYAPADGVVVERLRLLSRALWMTEADRDGAVVLPVREGLRVPATGVNFFRQELPTSGYEGCHMQMLGLLKGGAGLLATWDDVGTVAELERLPAASAAMPGTRVLATSLLLQGTARSLRLAVLGRASAVTLAQAYRAVARQRGLVQTWDDKIRRNPLAERLIGATNIKLWSTLSRTMRVDGTEKDHRVEWTFAEAAEVAEHLHRDLGLERVLFTLGGWIHRGYDNQHPDILPTAPECGGDEAFAEAMRRIAATGFTPCLHDNYQDIYRDAPSWDEKWIMRNARGELAKGGIWAGGQAYLTCSRMATALARRPQNLAAVRRLTGPIAYFIDTTYAADLQTCHAPEHPLTRAEDLHWKCVLSDEARDTMGLFGSEDGREWAIPHADFFEGLTGVSGGVLHAQGTLERLEAEPLPIFEMVYHDCIAAYGKYGYAPEGAAAYVLRHLLMARPLNVHSLPPHRYWTQGADDELPLAPSASAVPEGADAMRITYAWQVAGPLGGAWSLFVHIVDQDGRILGQDDHRPALPLAEWRPGTVTEAPRLVHLPASATPPLHLQAGLFHADDGRRARLRGMDAGGRSYRLGTFTRQGGAWRLERAVADGDAGCFVRGDGGWSAGMHSIDRFIKNVHEVLAPLHAVTARRLMDGWRHLDAAGELVESRFGEVRVVAHFGHHEVQLGTTTLPPYGFLVESPTFTAFHATRHAGVEYPGGALFTVRSLDGADLARSKRIRIYHGFGPERLVLNGRSLSVGREQVLER